METCDVVKWSYSYVDWAALEREAARRFNTFFFRYKAYCFLHGLRVVPWIQDMYEITTAQEER